MNTEREPGGESPDPTTPLQPVAESQRIEVMDILRGFALIGIIFMNVEWFTRPVSELGSFDTTLTGLDHAAGWLVRCFVEGKFYKLFTLLFGMGFAVMLLRAQDAGRPFNAWFARRMIVLFAIGMLHAIVIWPGDILHAYAIGGLVFLLWIHAFRTRRLRRFGNPGAFLKIGIVWLVLPMFVASIAGLVYSTGTDNAGLETSWATDMHVATAVEERLAEPPEPPPEDDAIDAAPDESALTEEQRIERRIDAQVERKREQESRVEAEERAVSGGSLLDGVAYRWSILPQILGQSVGFTVLLMIPIFLIGYWFIASGVLRDHRRHKTLFRSMAWIGMIAGLFLSVGSLMILQHPAYDVSRSLKPVAGMLFHTSQFFLSAGYVGIIVLLSDSPYARKALTILAPFGRMALTNYILQSVFLAAIFHDVGAGWYGEVSRSYQVLIAAAIVVIQIAYSSWWLKRFRFGPLEWVWRCATYKSLQPIRAHR